MELWHTTQAWLMAALIDSAGKPWLLGLGLILISFLLEDLAIAVAASLATQGLMTCQVLSLGFSRALPSATLACTCLAWVPGRVPWLRRTYITNDQTGSIKLRLERNLLSAVLLARVIPGLRLISYTLCGFTKVSVLMFCLWVSLAVALWTAGLFWLGDWIGPALARELHVPQAVAVALPILAIAIAVPVFKRLRRL